MRRKTYNFDAVNRIDRSSLTPCLHFTASCATGCTTTTGSVSYANEPSQAALERASQDVYVSSWCVGLFCHHLFTKLLSFSLVGDREVSCFYTMPTSCKTAGMWCRSKVRREPRMPSVRQGVRNFADFCSNCHLATNLRDVRQNISWSSQENTAITNTSGTV